MAVWNFWMPDAKKTSLGLGTKTFLALASLKIICISN